MRLVILALRTPDERVTLFPGPLSFAFPALRPEREARHTSRPLPQYLSGVPFQDGGATMAVICFRR